MISQNPSPHLGVSSTPPLLPRDPRSYPTVSVVICTLDEHEAIGGVLDELRTELADVSHEIIVVDDSANDLTAMVVEAHGRAHPNVRLIRREGCGGLASAAIAGWDAARGETLAIMDGDGQHDPKLVGKMLRRRVETKADVVVASRYLESAQSGLCGARHLISRGGVMLSGLLLGLRLADPMSGCFLMRREWYESVRPQLSGLGFKILVDIVASGRRRPRVQQIPTLLRPRAGGESKLDLRVAVDLVALLIEKRTGGAVSARMTQFLLVGATGLIAHLSVLSLMGLTNLPFWMAQTGAIMAAMSWNFVLNNSLTFRDRRLSGSALWRGLLSFYAACLGGALISEAAGTALAALDAPWLVAGVAGALLGAVWNYQAARRLTWRAARNGDAPPNTFATQPQILSLSSE